MHDGAVSGGPAVEAPSGPALLHWLSTEAGVRDRALSDGARTVTYARSEALLEEIDRHLERSGVATEYPIALECSQSVSGALMLLYALSRQYDVVLLPDLGSRAKEQGLPRFIPSFCQYVVSTSVAAEPSTAFSPQDDIHCARNDGFSADPVVASFVGPDVYLRTSGTTGRPKLARMSHQKWLNNAAACVDRWALTADDRFSVPVPIFHSYGFGAAFLPGLLAGAAMDLLAQGNLAVYVDRETRVQPNVAFLTPSMCDMFLARRRSPRIYRVVVTAGDRVKPETVADFEPRFGPLLNLYGSAEMGAVSAPSPSDRCERRIGTAGYPLAGIELRTREAESGHEGSIAEGAGVVQCRQANGFSGYLIEDDRWRFEPAGEEWFEMLDLARIRADGYMEILGRSALSVKRDGLLVIFADVEAALERVAGVQRAAVVVSGESRRGSRLIGICQVDHTQAAPLPDTVRQHCRTLLPIYAVPDEVVTIDTLPQLPSGKIDRRALRDWIDQSRAQS